MQASNPAYERLVQDYTDYHLALVVVGSVFTLALLSLGVFSMLRLRRAPRGFERRTHLVSAVASAGVGLLLALVVAANLSNVLDPRRGLAGAIGTPEDLKPAASAHLTRSVTDWMRSGSSDVPALIQGQVDARLAWQEPKALISVLLLVAFASVSIHLWRGAVARSRAGNRVGAGRVLAGSAAVLGSFVLMLMVLGNTQAAYAPIVMTLLFG